MLGRLVLFEVILAAVVLGVTALLNLAPPVDAMSGGH
jgi:hypothetical protein